MAYCTYSVNLQADGAELFTIVCLPEKEGKFPMVIYRSPYEDTTRDLDPDTACQQKLTESVSWLKSGYGLVFQHCRGTGKSTGDCIPYLYEREDGLQLQQWIRQQPFYNGELYLCGASYTASVHFVTAPFAEDIKGAILEVQDCQRYNCNYRNGFFKVGLHGGWYVNMYRKKRDIQKNFTPDSYKMLPLSDFSKTVFGEAAEDFDEVLRHPDRNDSFWSTHHGGGEARGAIKHARIPILLVTGFYDIYTGGVFDMWNELDEQTRAMCALVVHPYSHGGKSTGQPISFAGGMVEERAPNYKARWLNAIRGKEKPPFTLGKVTYYKLFDEKWCCDGFYDECYLCRIPLGQGSVTYRYDPGDPANFPGGLSANFGGSAWQDQPHSRQDIISLFTPAFDGKTYIKGKMRAKLKIASDCEDTCFYIRVSLCKAEGDYGLRDDIQQISNFVADYVPNDRAELAFFFDEHAFVIGKGEQLRIDVSSSAYPHYVPHTNQKGLFSLQKRSVTANNTVFLEDSYLELPVVNEV